MVFDLIMKPADSFWKKKYKQEAALRRRAEVNAHWADETLRCQEDDVKLMIERDVGQAKAIEALTKDRQALQDRIAELETELERRDKTISMLREMVRAERDAKLALKSWQRLVRQARTWEEPVQTETEAAANE